MRTAHRSTSMLVLGIVAAIALSPGTSYGQEVTDPALSNLPNPYQTIRNWAPFPEGRTWGSTAGIDIGPDGQIWAIDRCGANTCEGSNVPPIVKIDRNSGKILTMIGAGMFVFPHGIHVDRDGNVWVTDGQGSKDGTKGHQVIKLSPDGKVLMRLGKAGVAARGSEGLTEPNDVITAPNGDIFVADGHGGQGANATPDTVARIVKFSKDGKFIKEFGKWGTGPGEFKTPHALVFDPQGRLIVADRGNMRLQMFDQDGKFLNEWKQFSRVSGLFIRDGMLYAIDSETSPTNHPGWKKGVRIGSLKDMKVTMFIPPHQTDNPAGAAGEGIAVDAEGNIYAAENTVRGLTKYVKK
jgi:hypothetical protein